MLLLGSIDLSIEGVMGFAGSFVAFLVVNNSNSNDFGILGILFVILISTFIGAITGIIHVKARIATFIVTYAVGSIMTGVAVLVYQGTPIQVKDELFVVLSQGKFIGIPYITIIAFAIFIIGALILMLGLLSSLQDLYTSDIPSLIIAEKIWPPLATIFSVVSLPHLHDAVPLLLSVSARFAQEKTTKFYGLTAGLAAIACFVALELPFRQIVNIIYGVNGYVGILLIFFMLAKSFGITKKFTK